MLKTIFGSRNDRYLKSKQKIVKRINALEADMQALSDDDLSAKTAEFKERFSQGETLDRLLPETFAVCREALVRKINKRHYDVQLIGGIVLHEGKIAEMRTGEGKTLVATLPVYLNALTGNGVHVVTVNDYLAKRDAEMLRPLYEFLGLSVGIIVGEMSPDEKFSAYQCDVIYGTNNEFGFDYLRTNMSLQADTRLQKKLNFAIIDEVDSILIDEARTPLIISGPADTDNDIYRRLNNIVPHLERQSADVDPKNEDETLMGDYIVDEKDKQVTLTEVGHDKVEKLLADAGLLEAGTTLYDPNNIGLFHHLNACLRAHSLFEKDVSYIVKDGEIIIVDEFTGRTMPGRRWSDGLHQAIEAKEGVEIQDENQTLASITFQNFFRQYDKLAGMTGTADTEAYEFQQIYNLETIVIPTNLPVIRKDFPDFVYLNQQGKFKAVVDAIRDCYEKGQPVLVGTTSIEVSELIGEQLKKTNIPFELLNAKQHQREAIIVANAGKPSAVTIATNMAGRGTDIVLGGNLEKQLDGVEDESEREKIKADWKIANKQVIDAGGLHIIGTERHESRRIDNQLRGRSGRQGDPGSSRFYLSLDDNLMRIFASPGITKMMQRSVEEDEAIESKMLSRAIENAQKKVEAHNFDIRKQLIEYDDVSNDQRKVIYAQREQVLESESVRDMIDDMRDSSMSLFIDDYIPEDAILADWNIEGLQTALLEQTGLTLDIDALLAENNHLQSEDVKDYVVAELKKAYEDKVNVLDEEEVKRFERVMLLQLIDEKWREHLKNTDYLRQAVGLRASRAQKDPKQEYKREAFFLFEDLLDQIALDATRYFSQVQFRSPEEMQAQRKAATAEMQEELTETNREHPKFNQSEVDQGNNQSQPNQEQSFNTVRTRAEATETGLTIDGYDPAIFVGVGRNQPCPCGSGKKFKHCCGRAV